jgi:hypothetical protein
MRAVIRLIPAVALAACLLALVPMPAAACSCAAAEPEQLLTVADAAFAGTVIGVQPGVDPKTMVIGGPGLAPVVYEFAVDGVAKGSVGAHTFVRAGADSAACGMTFGVGERWLVFAIHDGEMLGTGLCSGNAPLAIGESPPLAMSAPTGEPSSAAVSIPAPMLVAVGSFSLLVVASLIAFRTPRRST